MFQIPAKEGNSTVEFEDLIKAACEIAQAKENCLEAGGASVSGISGVKPGGGKAKKGACHRCNTTEHSE